MIIDDIFGKAKPFQAYMDKVSEKLDGVQWKKWFKWKYTPTLTFEGVLAKSARVYAGTVVAEGARAPRRERLNLQAFTGSVASMKDAFQLGHKEMRDLLDLEDAIKRGVVEYKLHHLKKIIFIDSRVGAEGREINLLRRWGGLAQELGKRLHLDLLHRCKILLHTFRHGCMGHYPQENDSEVTGHLHRFVDTIDRLS